MNETARSKDWKIVGHEAKWQALQRAFARGQIPQTLLISGPANTGKWTLARHFAQLLLCPNAAQSTADALESTADASQSSAEADLPSPCGACRVCHQVEIETFPDFRVFRPIVSEAKNEADWVIAPESLEGSLITVAMARKFGDEAMRRPSVGVRKVMIIERAERMNPEAQNALLKTFEEPVPGLTIIFTADNPNGLLPTVRSRCWHLPLGLTPDAAIQKWLDEQAANIEATRQDAAHIDNAIRAAAGRPGAAWREWQRLRGENDENDAQSTADGSVARFAQAMALVKRITRSQPVGALALSEEAVRLSKLWWEEDQRIEATLIVNVARGDLKKADAKIARSSAARFLDELSNAYRAQWKASLASANGTRRTVGADAVWSDGLDQIRKTRHYILHNANLNLSLDVLFGRLIAAQQNAPNERSPKSLRS